MLKYYFPRIDELKPGFKYEKFDKSWVSKVLTIDDIGKKSFQDLVKLIVDKKFNEIRVPVLNGSDFNKYGFNEVTGTYLGNTKSRLFRRSKFEITFLDGKKEPFITIRDTKENVILFCGNCISDQVLRELLITLDIIVPEYIVKIFDQDYYDWKEE